jgi:putative chitinase
VAFSFALNITIMNINELDSYNLGDAVKFNEQLNPRIWQGNKMRPEVRAKLLEIAEDFKQSLGLSDLNVKDITLSGSNAGYTYTPHSDIDLHLVVDLPQADVSDVYRELFDAKKFQYNETHNIKIGGYDVELYVENANKSAVSQGIFSVVNDDWIKIPLKKRATINDNVVKNKYDVIKNHIESAIESADLERLTNTAAKIKKMRQSGLDRNGELGPENLAYKMLRSQGVIKQLYDARTAAKDQELSLRERTIQVKQPFRYGFRTTEDVSSNPNGVSPETKMFLSEKPALSQQEIVTDFVNYCVEQLGIEQQPTIKFKRDPEWSARNKTFGRYNHETNLLEVSLAGRHVMDILRTVAHELTHQRQHEVGNVPDTAGETGSEWENEANARAGVLMREYAQQHPEYFADGQIEEGLKNKKSQPNVELSRAQISRVAHPLSHDPSLAYTQKFAQSHYPTLSNDPDEAFNKLLQRGMMHSKENDIIHDKKIVNLEKQIADLRKALASMNTTNALEEASGYIPTKKQAKDPRFSMALTRDIRPGATGKEANKLNLQTDSQGRPALLMKTANQMHEELANDLRWEFALLEQEFLGEINMSPSSLRELSAQTGALAGMEFEMCVPGAGDNDDGDQEPDYNFDQRCRSIQDARDFFYDGDFNSRRDIENMSDRMQNDYAEWLYERIDRDFVNESEYLISEWIANNVDESEWNPDDLEGEARQEALDEFISNVDADPSNDYYQKVLDEYREENQDSYDESDWLDAEDLDLMSGVENAYSINWPHWRSTGGGEASIEEVADSFRDAVGRPILASTSYHSGRVERPSTTNLQYIVEPDSSIDVDDSDDQGLEFVSPPLPIEELLSDLNKVKAWADRTGCYTNDSTGLHINVSVPGWTQGTDQLDYVKLALLLGDEFVLDSFGRAGNTYAKSAMGKIRSAVKHFPDRAQELMDRMKSGMDQLASKVVHSRSTDKYTSINVKNGYIEFRSPGGDWLNDNFAEIDNTLRRFTVALSAAVDPDAYRQEYLKKLYKLLDVSGEKDPLSYFAKFAAGELPKAALKSFVRQAQLERGVKRDTTGGKKMWWSVTNPPQSLAGIEVVATSREEAIEKALGADGYPAWANTRQSIVAKPLRPYEEPAAPAAAAQPIPGSTLDLQRQRAATEPSTLTRPGQGQQTFSGEWKVMVNDEEVYRFGGVGNNQGDANRIGRDWILQQIRQGTLNPIEGAGIEVLPVMSEHNLEEDISRRNFVRGLGAVAGMAATGAGAKQLRDYEPQQISHITQIVDAPDAFAAETQQLLHDKYVYNRLTKDAFLKMRARPDFDSVVELEQVFSQPMNSKVTLMLNHSDGRGYWVTPDVFATIRKEIEAGQMLARNKRSGGVPMAKDPLATDKLPNSMRQSQPPTPGAEQDRAYRGIGAAQPTESIQEFEDELEEGLKSTLAGLAAAGAMAFTPAPTSNTAPDVGSAAQPAAVQQSPASAAESALSKIAQAAGIKGVELAQFLAQCAHETGDFLHLEELGGNRYLAQYDPTVNPAKAKALGNTEAGDGAKYKGRGFIQITGKANYAKAGQALGIDLVNNPELAARPDVAAKVAVWYWQSRVQPRVQDFSDTRGVTKQINPGLKGLADRQSNFKGYQQQLAAVAQPKATV